MTPSAPDPDDDAPRLTAFLRVEVTPRMREQIGHLGAWALEVRRLAEEYQRRLNTGLADKATFVLTLEEIPGDAPPRG